MRSLIPLWALFLSAAILLTGSGLQTLLLPVRATYEGFSELEIGLLGSAYYAGFLYGCLRGTRVLRSVGHIRTFSAMSALGAAAALLAGLVPSMLCWLLVRAATGFAFALLAVVIESWLNELAEPRSRSLVLSVYMVVNLLAIMAGQSLLSVYAVSGLEPFALVAILGSLAVLPVALSPAPGPAAPKTVELQLGRLWMNAPAAFVTCVTVGLTNGSFWALGPRFAQSRGADEVEVAGFMTAAVLGGALGQLPIGRLSDLVDRRFVLVLAAGVASAACFCQLLGTARFDEGGTWVLYGLAATWGAVGFPIYAVGVAHANDIADPREFVSTSGGLLILFALGGVIGPSIASLGIERVTESALFAFMAASYLAMAMVVFARLVSQRRAPADDRVRFDDALQSAHTISPVFDVAMQSDLVAEAAEASDVEDGQPPG